MCIKGFEVISTKHHKRNTTTRSDKQHNYTLGYKTLDETEVSEQKEAEKRRGERIKNSIINAFNISFPFSTKQLGKKNDSGRN